MRRLLTSKIPRRARACINSGRIARAKVVRKVIKTRPRRALGARFRFGLHTVSAASRHSVDRHGIRRRLWCLPFGVRLVLLDGPVWRSGFSLPRRGGAGLGHARVRLADADALPFDYTDYAKQIRDYFTETVSIARRRNLASGFDEKSMNEALDDFAKEAERVNKLKQDAVRELARAKAGADQ